MDRLEIELDVLRRVIESIGNARFGGTSCTAEDARDLIVRSLESMAAITEMQGRSASEAQADFAGSTGPNAYPAIVKRQYVAGDGNVVKLMNVVRAQTPDDAA